MSCHFQFQASKGFANCDHHDDVEGGEMRMGGHISQDSLLTEMITPQE